MEVDQDNARVQVNMENRATVIEEKERRQIDDRACMATVVHEWETDLHS
jgi:hypothetical protein